MKKIIPIFFIIILGAAAFFLFKKTDNKDNGGNEEKLKQELSVKLEEDYRKSVKEIFNDYANNLEDLQKVTALKGRLLELKVPTELKALHLNLVLTMTKTESYIQNKEEEDKIAGEKVIKETREKYPWLND